MAAAAIHIVSLTVTEKGYCHEPSTGRLNRDHPDIAHDLAHPLPRSAPGFLVRALQARRRAGLPPFTVLCCDKGICITGGSDEDGNYEFLDIELGSWKIQVWTRARIRLT